MNVITLAAPSEQSNLVAAVAEAKGRFTSSVQVAATQAIGHFLMTGDTSFSNKLLDVFGDKSLGRSQFVMFMENFGGVELIGKTKTKAARFIQDADKREELPELGDHDGVVEYMQDIFACDWSSMKAAQSQEALDVIKAVEALIKKVSSAQKNGKEVHDAELTSFLSLAVATYTSSKHTARAEGQ